MNGRQMGVKTSLGAKARIDSGQLWLRKTKNGWQNVKKTMVLRSIHQHCLTGNVAARVGIHPNDASSRFHGHIHCA